MILSFHSISGEFNCSINSDAFRLRNIYGTDYKLLTATQLDREEHPSYEVSFVCQDHGASPMSSTAQITVSILDENDSTPRFSKQTYSVIISETQPIGSPIVNLQATDKDLGQNSMIEYRPLGKLGTLRGETTFIRMINTFSPEIRLLLIHLILMYWVR